MKYIFCGNMFPNIEEDFRKMKSPPPVSSHKFMSGMLDGLLENGRDVFVANIPRIRYFPHYPKIFFRKKLFMWKGKILGENIGFVNLPLLNYFSHRFGLGYLLKKYISKNSDEKYILISFNNYLPQNYAMLSVCEDNPNVKACIVLGDIHGKFGLTVAGHYDGLKGKIRKLMENEADLVSCKYDMFGFLTKDMATALGVQNKPFVVIEGIFSGWSHSFEPAEENSIKTIFYAGALEKEYAIFHLLRAFALIKDNSYRLVIAGSGGASKEVIETSKNDDRIVYLGVITPEEVEKQQKNATVVVNPRTSEYEYVRYSFASKNMECLASGRPYIAHKLPCNPPEYDNYILYPYDESDDALRDKIVEICELPVEKRNEIGIRARNFILNEKNQKVQMKKIIDMVENCF